MKTTSSYKDNLLKTPYYGVVQWIIMLRREGPTISEGLPTPVVVAMITYDNSTDIAVIT